jgi:hypothetical protein
MYFKKLYFVKEAPPLGGRAVRYDLTHYQQRGKHTGNARESTLPLFTQSRPIAKKTHVGYCELFY